MNQTRMMAQRCLITINIQMGLDIQQQEMPIVGRVVSRSVSKRRKKTKRRKKN